MIVRLKAGEDPDAARRLLAERGLWVRRLDEAAGGTVHFLVESHSASVDPDSLLGLNGIAGVAVEASAHPRVDAQPPVIRVAGVEIGSGRPPVLMAGPCGVESQAQVRGIAAGLRGKGVAFLRGGAFKPRTSPYSFHGHGEKGLRWLKAAAEENGMRVVSEAMSPDEAPLVAEYADLVQIGSRSMQNYPLLRAAGRTGKPILLKRAMSATVEEWLAAGEWCLHHGAGAVIFCERGVRGFDPSSRNQLDLGAVALLAHVHRQPVVVDPSHATGRRDLIGPLSRAALAAGAAGLLVETHDAPGAALSDGPQALRPSELDDLVVSIERAIRPEDSPRERRAAS